MKTRELGGRAVGFCDHKTPKKILLTKKIAVGRLEKKARQESMQKKAGEKLPDLPQKKTSTNGRRIHAKKSRKTMSLAYGYRRSF